MRFELGIARFGVQHFTSGLPVSVAAGVYVNLAAEKPWQFMPNWKHGSTVEFIIFRV